MSKKKVLKDIKFSTKRSLYYSDIPDLCDFFDALSTDSLGRWVRFRYNDTLYLVKKLSSKSKK